MGKASRDKGSRFERKASKFFSDTFDMNIRRVPLSGGLDIKSDLYCPEDDSFPYFVECKNHKSFRFDSLFSGISKLISFHRTASRKAKESYLNDKYTGEITPILIFTGGNFKEIYVLFGGSYRFLHCRKFKRILIIGGYHVMTLTNFLGTCNKDKLKLKKKNMIIHDEDDGEI